MFHASKLAFVVAVSIASRALADCTPTFTEDTPYIVSMTELPSFAWVNNATIGSLGVNLRSTVPATEWYLSTTPFGGYVFSIDTAMSSCLYASRNAKVPGSGKIYSSIGCFDGVGELDKDEDFTFTCASCDASGGTNCFITSSVTTECANTPDNALHYPSGEDEEDQIRTAACSETWYQKWDVTAVTPPEAEAAAGALSGLEDISDEVVLVAQAGKVAGYALEKGALRRRIKRGWRGGETRASIGITHTLEMSDYRRGTPSYAAGAAIETCRCRRSTVAEGLKVYQWGTRTRPPGGAHGYEPHGIPVDLLDRCMIVKTDGYTREQVGKVVQLRGVLIGGFKPL
ncbi:hypothetical protein B0H17DRAFT_1338607 [Mycena rosella]|uniref:Uncharacterized protein n=1 Tax=Mycena rosella TaxID=1033263 RepID=A0AAD7CLI7_MYCRO|nr:hypothetical protein B0H17DRAFT_1338607 [Mycena rosella]